MCAGPRTVSRWPAWRAVVTDDRAPRGPAVFLERPAASGSWLRLRCRHDRRSFNDRTIRTVAPVVAPFAFAGFRVRAPAPGARTQRRASGAPGATAGSALAARRSAASSRFAPGSWAPHTYHRDLEAPPHCRPRHGWLAPGRRPPATPRLASGGARSAAVASWWRRSCRPRRRAPASQRLRVPRRGFRIGCERAVTRRAGVRWRARRAPARCRAGRTRRGTVPA